MFAKLVELRGTLPRKTAILCEIIGVALILTVWTMVSESGMISKGILPSPLKIIGSIPELHFQDALIRNTFFSFKLNVLGNLEAIAFAIPLGFLIGLIPALRAVFLRYVEAVRFLPLSAVVGIFIVAFGIEANMKIQFLAFAVFIYLLPVVIQRIDQVEKVYLQTAYTIGASPWQTVKIVFIPAVLARVYDDVRNLAALSWTYIIIAEMVNAAGGGVGALAFICSRQGRVDKTFAILLVIILIGIIQDKVLKMLGKVIFPYYQKGDGGES